MSDRREPWKLRTFLAVIATLLYLGLGAVVARGMADTLVIAGVVIAVAIVLACISPMAAAGAMLLAASTWQHLYAMPKGSFSLLELAVVTGVLGIGIRWLVDVVRSGVDGIGRVIPPATVTVPAGLLVLATGVSLLTLAQPQYRDESLREVRFTIVEPLAAFVAIRWALRSSVARWWVASMAIVAGSVVAGYGAYQSLVDDNGVRTGSLIRAIGPYSHPNNLGLYLERTFLFTAGIAAYKARWWPLWLLGVIQLVGIALTWSRGSFIAVTVGLAIILLMRRLWAWVVVLAGVGAFGAIVAWLVAPDRIADIGGSGNEPTRFAIWRSAWRMLEDHPIFGVGPDQFLYEYFRRYVEPSGWNERWTSHPHNLVLDVWLRLGAIGLAAMILVVIGLVIWCWRKRHVLSQDPVASGALAALIGGAAHAMVDVGYFLPDLAFLTWAMLAFIYTVHSRRVAEVSARGASMETTWPDVHAPAAGEYVAR